MYSIYPGQAADCTGYILSEEIYPVFHGLDIVGVRDRDVQLLIAYCPCPRGQKCSVFFEGIKSITQHYPQVSDIQVNYPPRAPPSSYYPDLVCYKLHGSSRTHQPESWGRFMEKALYGMGLDPFNRPERQRILVAAMVV